MDGKTYKSYVAILEEELIPAMGCTEPIALAYAAALARKTLGALPEEVEVTVSANIIKNVKSVVVPHTGSMRGIEAAAAAGIVAGDAELELEVLSRVTEADVAEMREYLDTHTVSVRRSESGYIFDIQVLVRREPDSAFVQLAGNHTNVIRIEKNGEVLSSRDFSEEGQDEMTPRDILNVEDIVAFADTVNIDDVRETLDRQIRYNTDIAREGLTGKWGAAVGCVLLKAYGNGVANRAKAIAAAGSDARMSGCELPVIINSGSGNQGMTASLPVIEYANELGASDELLYRALVVSNLITIHLKSGIGRLSAYCGATSAGCGAAAGITYLYGGKANEIAHTVVNAVAIASGMICDGAKPSCSMKLTSGVSTAVLSAMMAMDGHCVTPVEGIIEEDVDKCIRNLTAIGRDGMNETDRLVLGIMTHKC